MKILINENAATNYYHRCYRHAPASCGMLHSPEFAAKLRAVEGTWLEVETAHIFRDQFNTVPIPGVSESGLRARIEDVAAIKDDIRIGAYKCAWCGKWAPDANDGRCPKCGKADLWRPLNPRTVSSRKGT